MALPPMVFALTARAWHFQVLELRLHLGSPAAPSTGLSAGEAYGAVGARTPERGRHDRPLACFGSRQPSCRQDDHFRTLGGVEHEAYVEGVELVVNAVVGEICH